ncbi:MAG: DUF169 domain-containing protein [Candidatus Methanoplasma sp.]|jgi:uncharacterized protein (DUF169 family)|nr:DUF169 domain-containing protein [Candidatus Methanoplasma sp.]
MSETLETNAEYAGKMKSMLNLRSEPVAVKLIKEGCEYPPGPEMPEPQISHCQAVFRARKGGSFRLPFEKESCHVGAAVLGMTETPAKAASGEFHAGIGIHDSVEAAKRMMDERVMIPYRTIGETVCPLKDADFVPDVVIIIDTAERMYWIVSLMAGGKGGRASFSTAPFQCACEDVTAVPIVTGSPNVSLGCFGCRKKTDMAGDELACGIPYGLMPEYVSRLERYSKGPLVQAKRG